jgi:hypothetical protein
MKIHFIKSSIILMLTLSIATTGCLKDKAYENGTIQSGSTGSGEDIKVISLGITVSGVSPQFLQAAYNLSDNDTTVNLVPVELGGSSAATQDIHVTLAEDDSLINDYNDANGTDYTSPGSVITPVSNVVVIPKGSRTGFLQVKFKISDLLTGNYALGIKIASIAEKGYTISGNLSTGIVALGPKNQYDGKYSLRIKTVGWGAYGIDDGVAETWPTRVSIVTTGLASVVFNTEAGVAQPAFAGGSITGFGATEPQFTFDLSTNKLVEVKNLIPDDGRGRAFHLNPAITDSRYDPATKTIYAAYIMNQNGRPNMYIYDTLVYKGSR